MIAAAIRTLAERRDLDRQTMYHLFSEVMDGRASATQQAALLIALRMKGETPEEITGAAMAMRERVTPLEAEGLTLIDTCGTGGDDCGTFNISTVAAFVAAGAGAHVAKHGNRAVSSACGSADLLAALGVHLDLDAARTSQVLRRVGIAFLFAPKLHPAMSAVSAVRRELGLRTIFNVLGPLTNPAFAKRQILGVYSDHLVEVVARVLLALGCEHAMVVRSRDGLDEIAVSAPTRVAEVRAGTIETYELQPEDLGVGTHALRELAGGDAAHNAAVARAVLEGERGARQDVVLANAGAALYVAGLAATLRGGVDAARLSLERGCARAKLQELVRATNELAEAK